MFFMHKPCINTVQRILSHREAIRCSLGHPDPRTMTIPNLTGFYNRNPAVRLLSPAIPLPKRGFFLEHPSELEDLVA